MRIDAALCTLRPWREDDAGPLAHLANNREIARNLTDRFPHPYTFVHAKSWVAQRHDPIFRERAFAIEYQGELAGGIGYSPQSGIHIYAAHVGYWVGEPLWGRGIATAALRAFTPHIFATSQLRRLESRVYAWNPASVRVLEKAGFTFEGRLRHAVWRLGEFSDLLIYGLLREEATASPAP